MSLPILILQHIGCEGPGLLEAPLRKTGRALSLVRPYAGEAVPRAPDGYGGILVLGGPMNVDETARYPYLAEERALLERALEKEVPLLGLCLGSQMIARAAGARVYKASRSEIGLLPISCTEAAKGDALLEHFPRTLEVFQWHGDTFDLPAGAVHLARSEVCPNQALRVGSCAWGLQFHVEVTPAIARSWITEYENDLRSNGSVSPEALRAECADEKRFAHLLPLARRLGEAWAAILR